MRRAKDMVFHIECFCCSMCMKEMSTGDELYHVGGTKFVCKEDYDMHLHDIESKFSNVAIYVHTLAYYENWI